MGLGKDLNTAITIAARNAIAFLASRAGLTPHDALYAMQPRGHLPGHPSLDIVRGEHAMIPKSVFTGELRQHIAIV